MTTNELNFTYMKKIYFTFLVITCLATFSVSAQDQLFSLQYSVGFGMGNTNDFVSKTSFRGLSFEYRKFLNPKSALGFEIGYNFFYEEKGYDTYVNDNQSLSGKQFRYLHALPILAAYDYYFKPDAKVNPFAGVGVGCVVLDQRVDMGIYTFSDDAVQFAFRPEAGVLIEANPNLDLIIAAKYFIGTEANDMKGQSYLTLNLGFMF